MLRRSIFVGLCGSLFGIVCLTPFLVAAASDTRVADAAMKGDKDAIRSLIRQAADVNSAQGDGMTALHWAAMHGDAELAQVLLYAGASLRATTRLGGYTPLFIAAKSGHVPVIDVLLKAGAEAKVAAVDGLTPLMMAASSGNPDAVEMLVKHGADVNAKESDSGQTALSFAAAFNRPAAIRALLQHGANIDVASKVQQPPPPPPPQRGQGQGQGGQAPANGQRGAPPATTGAPAATTAPGAQPAPSATANDPAAAAAQNNGSDASAKGGGNPKGGLTPLMYAARDGSFDAIQTLVDSGANLNALSADKSTALLLATINGHFDIARFLVDHGADVNIASMDGAMPLYGVVNTQWARKSFHPQPTTKSEKTSYLDLMKAMLEQGADPNARLAKELWYSEYNFSLESASQIGTTAFWKCAEVGDIDGMRLLVEHGADPNIASRDGVTPLLIASGAGTHGNDDVMAPSGRLAAVKYLVEALHADVNAADNPPPPAPREGGAPATAPNTAGGANSNAPANGTAPSAATAPAPPTGASAPADAQTTGGTAGGQQSQQNQQTQGQNFGRIPGGGITALHNAAARGDNAMILYLVSKGARIDAVSKSGLTVADMANGPRQRIQPYPETVALLEMLGSKNSHKCVSC